MNHNLILINPITGECKCTKCGFIGTGLEALSVECKTESSESDTENSPNSGNCFGSLSDSLTNNNINND